MGITDIERRINESRQIEEEKENEQERILKLKENHWIGMQDEFSNYFEASETIDFKIVRDKNQIKTEIDFSSFSLTIDKGTMVFYSGVEQFQASLYMFGTTYNILGSLVSTERSNKLIYTYELSNGLKTKVFNNLTEILDFISERIK